MSYMSVGQQHALGNFRLDGCLLPESITGPFGLNTDIRSRVDKKIFFIPEIQDGQRRNQTGMLLIFSGSGAILAVAADLGNSSVLCRPQNFHDHIRILQDSTRLPSEAMRPVGNEQSFQENDTAGRSPEKISSLHLVLMKIVRNWGS